MKDKILFWFGFRTFKKNTGDEKKMTPTKSKVVNYIKLCKKIKS
jgi:hypothetical protein